MLPTANKNQHLTGYKKYKLKKKKVLNKYILKLCSRILSVAIIIVISDSILEVFKFLCKREAQWWFFDLYLTYATDTGRPSPLHYVCCVSSAYSFIRAMTYRKKDWICLSSTGCRLSVVSRKPSSIEH